VDPTASDPLKIPKIPSLIDLIQDLWARQKDIQTFIAEARNHATLDQKISALNLYGQNASRLGRLVRYTEAIGGGDKAQKLADSLNEALDTLAEEFGVKL